MPPDTSLCTVQLEDLVLIARDLTGLTRALRRLALAPGPLRQPCKDPEGYNNVISVLRVGAGVLSTHFDPSVHNSDLSRDCTCR